MNPIASSALISGGAQRIGKAVTLGLTQAGANVIINYNTSATDARETVNEASSLGIGTLTAQANIGDSQQVNYITREVLAVDAGERLGYQKLGSEL
jgi:NAD(P)-dependent dehydrogenase (short-subunit alcohol dehydrogenase family)